ncbi:MAG: hypothetical protein CM15mP18_3970 [Methanobacteriota archaeon]|nr:MAG: hypothetical protein CM15mP18_3970 [Euryarchaeota archaeon]
MAQGRPAPRAGPFQDDKDDPPDAALRDGDAAACLDQAPDLEGFPATERPCGGATRQNREKGARSSQHRVHGTAFLAPMLPRAGRGRSSPFRDPSPAEGAFSGAGGRLKRG